jgi:hypothetical protein
MAHLSKAMKSPIRLFVAISVSISLTLSTQIGANAGDGILFISNDQLDGYDRARFKLWVDADKNGCDTRAEVLIAEAIVKPKKAAKCKLTGGKWISSYDGIKYTNASKLDIDHLVPLAEAWRSGAWAWTDQQRMEYANDLEDEWALNAVTASVNRSKGDKDISQWLPKKNVCTYLSGWVTIKAKFELTVDIAEAKVINNYYESCGLGYQTKQLEPVAASPTPTASESQSPTPSPSASTNSIPSPSPTATVKASPTAMPTVTPGAFCTPAGAIGKSASGVLYTCKTSATDTRNRWRP